MTALCARPQACTRIIGELQNGDDIPSGYKSKIAHDIQKAANPYGTCGVLPELYATALERLVDADASGRRSMSSTEDDEDFQERDYRDVAFELLEPLQKHRTKETAKKLEELMAGHNTDAESTRKRYDAIIKRKDTHPAVVKLAIRRREQLRLAILEKQIISNTGSTSVEAALKAIPLKLKQAKESGDILQIEQEMENAMEVASLAERREIKVEEETGALLQEVFMKQQQMEQMEKTGLEDLFNQFPRSTSEDKITVLRYEADVYRSLAASGPAGANSRFFQSVNSMVFARTSPKQKKIATLEAKHRDEQAIAELERRRQTQAQEDLDEFLEEISQGRYIDPETSQEAQVVTLGEELVSWLLAGEAESSKWGKEVGARAKDIAKRKAAHVWIEVFLHRLQEAIVSQRKDCLLSVCDSITSHYTEERKKDRSQKMPARLLGPMNRGRRLVTQWTITPPKKRDAQTDKVKAVAIKRELKAACEAQDHERLHKVIGDFEDEEWLNPEAVLQGTVKYGGGALTVEELLTYARADYAALHEMAVKETRRKSKERKEKREAEGKQHFYDADEWDDVLPGYSNDSDILSYEPVDSPYGGGDGYYRSCCGDGSVDVGCAVS